jgi:hypothetical protein
MAFPRAGEGMSMLLHEHAAASWTCNAAVSTRKQPGLHVVQVARISCVILGQAACDRRICSLTAPLAAALLWCRFAEKDAASAQS